MVPQRVRQAFEAGVLDGAPIASTRDDDDDDAALQAEAERNSPPAAAPQAPPAAAFDATYQQALGQLDDMLDDWLVRRG